MIWLLDTNVLIHAVRGRPPGVRAQLQRQSPEDVAVSSITVAELWYGAEKSLSPARKRDAWRAVMAPFQVIAFDRDAAEHHARIRYLLRHKPIGKPRSVHPRPIAPPKLPRSIGTFWNS